MFAIFQFIRCNSRRFLPSQVDEEAHQLSYLQKHMANILTLLADSVDGEGDDSMVSYFPSFLDVFVPLNQSSCSLPPFQIVGSFVISISRYIVFAMYLDIAYV
jgi:hypothetical protein